MQPICIASPSEDKILMSAGFAFSHTRTTPKTHLKEEKQQNLSTLEIKN